MVAVDKIWVIVPSLNPDEKLLDVITGLQDENFKNIIVINDGSKTEYKKIFDSAQDAGCKIITHEQNKGKGAGIKSAIAYILRSSEMENKDIAGIVTVDGDNQHNPKDVKAVCESMLKNKNEIILGTRDFSDKNIPLRSRFGNKMTSGIFGFLVGMKLSDTQTGLRAIPYEYLEEFEKIQGDRYEYETNMLLEIKRQRIPYKEVKIKTIYIDENESSHFNPLLDSIKIYKYIFKFLLSSGSASIIDLAIFSLLVFVLPLLNIEQQLVIFVATVGARVISSFFNYMVNKNIVFQSKSSKHTFIKYYVLCVCQMLVSFLLVSGFTILFSAASGGIIVVKIVVDCILFLISYQIQQRWIFK